MLEVFEPGALNHFTFFRPILSTLSAFRNPILTHLPLSGFLGSLLCALIALTLGLAFSPPILRTLAAALSFLSGRAYLFLNFLPPLFPRLIPTLIMWGSTSLLTTPPRSLFSMCVPPIRSSPADGRSDSFSPSILLSFRNLFILGDFGCHHPLWDSRGTSDPRGEEVFDWVISSDFLPLNDPDTPALLHRSSGSRSSPDISFAPFSLALSYPGRCYRTWVLTICRFFCLSLSLRSFAPASVPLPSIFRKLAGMAFPLIRLRLFLGSPSTALFPFLGVCLRWGPGFSTFQSLALCLRFLMGPLSGVPLSSVWIFSSVPSHLRFAQMVSFPERCRSCRVGRLRRAPGRAIAGCLSSSPVSLLLSGASLPPLWVTLTPFALFFCGRALRLPASFPVSELARLGVGPGLCGSSWGAFASACPLMLPSACSGEALLACPL